MNTSTLDPKREMGALADDVRSVAHTAANYVGEKVDSARQGLNSAVESGKDLAAIVRDKAVEGAKATGDAVRDNPFYSAGIAFGLGALAGALVTGLINRR